MKIFLADRQDISRAGLMYIISQIDSAEYKYTEDKTELIECLKKEPKSVVILDYTLFDINDVSELLVLNQRFGEVQWLLFSEELSLDFIRLLIGSSQKFSILPKESSLLEIKDAILYVMHGRRYICQRMTEMLLVQEQRSEEQTRLTKTEIEILKDIAMGMTTKEIAEKRISSFHTVNTHRKNIFRKLEVNNVHEATKYALRAGLIDSAEYYI
jgi:DNA-binding NarL/FixJ family response regulator